MRAIWVVRAVEAGIEPGRHRRGRGPAAVADAAWRAVVRLRRLTLIRSASGLLSLPSKSGSATGTMSASTVVAGIRDSVKA
jgi:hypothetical protein